VDVFHQGPSEILGPGVDVFSIKVQGTRGGCFPSRSKLLFGTRGGGFHQGPGVGIPLCPHYTNVASVELDL